MTPLDSARSWVLVLVMGVACSIAYLDRVLLSFATPTIIKEFGLDGAVAGLLLSAFFWSYTVMQIPSGWLVDRYGTRRMLTIGYTLWSISCAATGWVSSLPALVACRLGLGIGESPLYPSGYRVVSTEFSEHHRGLASAIYSEGAKLGPAIGAPLAAWLIVAYGWREMFIIIGLVSLLWLIPWLMVAPRQEEDVDKIKSNFTRMELIALLKKREIWGIILGYFGYLYVFYVYITWMPSYLVLTRGFTILKAGWYSSLPFLLQFIFGLLGGWFADHLIHKGYSATTIRKSAIGFGLILGMSIVPAAFASAGETAAMLFALSLTGMGIAVPNMLAVPSALAPKGRGGFIGAIQNTAGNLGGVLAPIVTGVLYDATQSFTAALIGAGVMLCVSAFGYLVLIPRIEPITIYLPAMARKTAQAI